MVINNRQIEQKMVKLKSVPTGVKVVSVLYYVYGVIGIIFGLLFFVSAGFMDSIAKEIPQLRVFGAGLFFILGIILIGLGILGFFIGRGLWKAKSWARILVIIFAFFGIIASIVNLIKGNFGSIFGLVINGLICGYLLFNKNVKKTFA